MSRSLPFGELLPQLRAAGILVGIDDHLMLERLIERYDGHDPDELRDALAALLATSESEVTRIRAEFDALYNKPTAGPPPGGSRRKRVVVALWVCALVITTIVAWLAPRHDQVIDPKNGDGSDAAPIAVKPPPPPPPPPECKAPLPDIEPQWGTPPLPVGLGLICIAAGLLARQWIQRRRRWARKARKHRLEKLPGPRSYKISAGTSFPRALLDDIAILLTARSETRDLDVGRTVERTVRAGLAPVLAYRTRRRRRPVAVVIDRDPEMRPFRAAAAELATGLKDRGVVVVQSPGMNALTQPDAVVIVISTGAVFQDRNVRVPGWILDYVGRRELVWITPIEDARMWPLTLRAARVPMFPFHGAGLRAAARYLGGEDPALPASPPLRWEDIERMRAMRAISMDSQEVAERLRQKFLPHTPRSIHTAVHDEPLPDTGRAAAWLAEIEPGLDVRVRRFLLELLAAAKPAEASAGHLRWRRDRAVLMSGIPEHEDEARRELVALAASPLGDAVPGGPRSLSKMRGDPLAAPWYPRILWSLIPIVLGLGTLFAPVVRSQPVFDNSIYKLTLDPATAGLRRRLRVEPVVAETLDLYDQGVRVDAIGGSFDIPPGAHCYQIWQRVTRDRFEGSPALNVAKGPGELVINFSSSIEGPLEGQPYQISRTDGGVENTGVGGIPLTLPAGTWTANASREQHANWTQQITIESGKRLKLPAEMSTIYGEVQFLIADGMRPSSLLVDGVAWNGQPQRHEPGPLKLTSADPYFVVQQEVEVERGKKKEVEVKANVVGIVRFQVEPEAAARALKIVAQPGFQVVGNEIRGTGAATVELRAYGYDESAVSITAVPRTTVVKSVTLPVVSVTRSITLTLDGKPVNDILDVTSSETAEFHKIRSGQSVTLPIGDWTITGQVELGRVTQTVPVTIATKNPIAIDVKSVGVTLGPLPANVSRSDIQLNGKPLQQYPVVRMLSGTPISIAINTRYYEFKETVAGDASFPVFNLSGGERGVVVVTAPSDATVTTQPSNIPHTVTNNGLVLRTTPGPIQITAAKGSQSKTETVLVEAGKDIKVNIEIPTGDTSTAVDNPSQQDPKGSEGANNNAGAAPPPEPPKVDPDTRKTPQHQQPKGSEGASNNAGAAPPPEPPKVPPRQ